LPTLIVTAIFGTAWAGVYKIAEEVAKLLTEGFKLLDQVIYPELAKLITDGKAEKIWRLAMRAALVLFSIGLVFSLLIFAFGEPALVAIFTDDYRLATPLASLLVPAAALMGVAAPLFPIFYAADRPERAIYVRGSTVIVYLAVFIGLSFTIGRMAPGWAMLIGNLYCVIVLLIAAKATMKSAVKYQNRHLLAGRYIDTDDDS
jgi:O-antigen/teichoic acid export membrane protein